MSVGSWPSRYTMLAITLAGGKWSFSVGPEVGSGRPYSLTDGPDVMSCPVADYCVMARRGSLMSLSGGQGGRPMNQTYICRAPPLGGHSVVPHQGVLRGGHDAPGHELFGRVGERGFEDRPGSQLGRRRFCFGGVLRGNRKVRSRRCVRAGRSNRDLVRWSMDGEQGPHRRPTTDSTDRRGYLRGVGHHFVPEPRYVPCSGAVRALYREVDNPIRFQRARKRVAAMAMNEAEGARRTRRTVRGLARDGIVRIRPDRPKASVRRGLPGSRGRLRRRPPSPGPQRRSHQYPAPLVLQAGRDASNITGVVSLLDLWVELLFHASMVSSWGGGFRGQPGQNVGQTHEEVPVMRRVNAWLRVLGLLLVEVALFALFWFSGPVMGTVDWSNLHGWLANSTPQGAVTALIRVFGLVGSGWVLATSLLWVLAGVAGLRGVQVRFGRLRVAVRPATVPAHSRLVHAGVGGHVQRSGFCISAASDGARAGGGLQSAATEGARLRGRIARIGPGKHIGNWTPHRPPGSYRAQAVRHGPRGRHRL